MFVTRGYSMDILSEFCSRKDEEVLTAKYYPYYPKAQSDGYIPFTYNVLDAQTKEYRSLMSNLITTEGGNLALKTRASIDFMIKGYVLTQDGKFWVIEQVRENPINEQSKGALRFFKDTAQTERHLRLLRAENPMEIS